jgi:hypothetical protein
LEPGNSLSLPLTASLGDQVLGAATIEIAYDPDILRVMGCAEDPDSTFDLTVCNASQEAGRVVITAISARGVSGDVILARINFLATGVDGDTSPLVLTAGPFADISARAIDVALQHGQISVLARGNYHLYLPLILSSHAAYASDYTQHR